MYTRTWYSQSHDKLTLSPLKLSSEQYVSAKDVISFAAKLINMPPYMDVIACEEGGARIKFKWSRGDRRLMFHVGPNGECRTKQAVKGSSTDADPSDSCTETLYPSGFDRDNVRAALTWLYWGDHWGGGEDRESEES